MVESEGSKKHPEVGPEAEERHPAPIGGLSFLGTAPAAILVLAAFYTLYLAREFFLPVVLAVLLSFLLRPPVRWLARRGLPEPLGAALVLVLVLASTGFAAYRVATPARQWISEAPQTLRNAERTLRELRRPVEEVRAATKQVEELASSSSGSAPSEVEVDGPSLDDILVDGAIAIGAGAFTVTALLYFLLAAGDLFLRKLVRVLPRLRDKKSAVEIARTIQRDVSTYLFTITVVNLCLGVVVGIAMYLLGMPSPTLWGGMVALFNFVPYVGAIAGACVLFLAALSEFGTVSGALVVIGVFGTLTALEGYLLTPLVLGRRLLLNPVVVFIGVIFWGWLWGVPGAVLAVPILASLKIFCDNIERLTPLAEFLGP